MSKHHHHPHPSKKEDFNLPAFEWRLDLLKKILQMQSNEQNIIEAEFACSEASYFNKRLNKCRKNSGKKGVDEHEHNPEFTQEERQYVVQEIAVELQREAQPLAVLSQKPNEIIYGSANDPDTHLRYQFIKGSWLITAGKKVDAVIIDPAGKVIEIKPGPKISEYGQGGNLKIEEVHQSYNTISQIKSDEFFKNEGERVYRLVHDRDRASKKNEVSFKNGNWYKDHDKPCSKVSAHEAKLCDHKHNKHKVKSAHDH